MLDSVAAIIAGIAVTYYGLRTTTYAFGLTVIALAAVTAVTVPRRLASAKATHPGPSRK